MQTPPQFETLVREYKSQGAYQADARRLAGQGWSVQNVVERNPRSGCVRGCLLGLLALVFRPKPTLIVTYQRAKAAR